MTKTGRNDPCPCGSGQKYKYCHFDAHRDRLVTVDPRLHRAGTPSQINYKEDFANIVPALVGPLMRFCKDHGLYLFRSVVRVGDMEKAISELAAGELTAQHLISTFKRNTNQGEITPLIAAACAEYDSFRGREGILLDAIEAHFAGKYTLSVPALFAQLEGILREIGGLKRSATFKPTIEKDIWDNRLLFGVGDAAQEFNAFISRLYSGQSADAFNRNSVLHGTSVSYDT